MIQTRAPGFLNYQLYGTPNMIGDGTTDHYLTLSATLTGTLLASYKGGNQKLRTQN